MKLGSGRRSRSGLPGPPRTRRRARRAGDRGGDGRRAATAAGDARRGHPAVLRTARRAARDPRAAEPDEREALETLALRARRPARAHRGAAARREARRWSIWPPATPRWPTRRGSIRRTAAQYDALETLQRRAGASGAAAADRVLRHLDDSGQRNGRVDGGLRRRPHAARASIGNTESGDRDSGLGIRASACRERRAPNPESPSPRPRTISRRCTKSCCAATARCSSRAGRFPISC